MGVLESCLEFLGLAAFGWYATFVLADVIANSLADES